MRFPDAPQMVSKCFKRSLDGCQWMTNDVHEVCAPILYEIVHTMHMYLPIPDPPRFHPDLTYIASNTCQKSLDLRVGLAKSLP